MRQEIKLLKPIKKISISQSFFDTSKKLLARNLILLIKGSKTSMGEKSMQIKYINEAPTPDEFNNLTEVVGWGR